MDSEMCLHTTYKKTSIHIIMCSSDTVMFSEFCLVQPFLFRIQLYQVRVSVCMFEPAYAGAVTNPDFRW